MSYLSRSTEWIYTSIVIILGKSYTLRIRPFSVSSDPTMPSKMGQFLLEFLAREQRPHLQRCQRFHLFCWPGFLRKIFWFCWRGRAHSIYCSLSTPLSIHRHSDHYRLWAHGGSFCSWILRPSYTFLRIYCKILAYVNDLKGLPLEKWPPFFIAVLPKTLLFHSRICMSFAWKVSHSGEISQKHVGLWAHRSTGVNLSDLPHI